jgi:hypothetical protein
VENGVWFGCFYGGKYLVEGNGFGMFGYGKLRRVVVYKLALNGF